MQTVLQDLRFACRMLARSPGFTAAAVLTLALGVSAVAAVFSLVNAYLLRSLPFERPEELVHIWQTDPRREFGDMLRVSAANFLDWRAQTRTFDQLGAYNYGERNVMTEDGPSRIQVGAVTDNLPSLLGVQPILGRSFLPDEGQPGRNRSVLLSHAYWQRHLNSDPQVLGKAVRLNGEGYAVVGVMPASFVFPLRGVQMWIPLALSGDESRRGELGGLLVVGRLRAGATVSQAGAEMTRVAQGLADAYPQVNKGIGARVVPLEQALLFFYDQFRLLFVALFVAAGCILLIVCTNLGSLLVVRAVDRSREVAVRAALGAPRFRLVRQFLTEGAVLAVSGGALAALMTAGFLRLLSLKLPQDLYRVGEVDVDGRVLAFALTASLSSVLFFALAPAVLASRTRSNEALRGAARSGSALRSRRLHNGLVATQVGFATILLAGALFALDAFVQQRRIEPGFNPRRVLTAETILAASEYPTPGKVDQFYQEALDRVGRLPGVAAAATVYPLPMNFELQMQEFQIEGRVPAPTQTKLSASQFSVTAHYFRTMGIPLMKGRAFDDRDRADAAPVAIVSQLLAEKHWPDEDPLGKRLLLLDAQGKARPATIVGVVGGAKDFLMHEPLRPQVYLPQPQAPTWRRFFVVQASAEPLPLAPAVRAAIQAIDGNVPVTNVRSMKQVVSAAMDPFVFAVAVLGTLGLGAMLLAAMGIYGVVGYVLRQRTHEIGVRRALGAPSREIVKLILGRGLRLAGIGLGLGLAGALALMRLAGAVDVVVLVGTPALLGAVSLLAGYLPARRAMRVDPMVALRCE